MTRAQSRRLGFECAALYAELAQLVAEGVIHVAIEACYPLDRVREALVHAGRPERTGKILFPPNLGLLDATGNRVPHLCHADQNHQIAGSWSD